MLDSYIYLQNTAWVFRGNVVSHMAIASSLSSHAPGTVARYTTAPIASSLSSHALGTVARYATAPIASSLISLTLGTVAC